MSTVWLNKKQWKAIEQLVIIEGHGRSMISFTQNGSDPTMVQLVREGVSTKRFEISEYGKTKEISEFA